MPLFTAAAIEMLAGGAVLLLESRLAREPLERFLTASTQAWLGLGYLVVFGSLVGFTAFALLPERAARPARSAPTPT